MIPPARPRSRNDPRKDNSPGACARGGTGAGLSEPNFVKEVTP
jgi:hypothetical protein